MGDVCNYLLCDFEIFEFIKNRGFGGKVCFVMLDEEIQVFVCQVGFEVMYFLVELCYCLEFKIVMMCLVDEVGVFSVLYVIGWVSFYDELLVFVYGVGLGDDFVVEVVYGNVGSVMFFVCGLCDWDQCVGGIVGQLEIKFMKCICNVEVCIEVIVICYGIVIGLVMMSLVGYLELILYWGVWCGNDVWCGVLLFVQICVV